MTETKIPIVLPGPVLARADELLLPDFADGLLVEELLLEFELVPEVDSPEFVCDFVVAFGLGDFGVDVLGVAALEFLFCFPLTPFEQLLVLRQL